MKPGAPTAGDPDSYVAQLDGWRLMTVTALREAVKHAAALDERIRWTHLVYFSAGPVLLIRAEADRVLFGFWRGKRLREIEPHLKPGGRYEMATLELSEGDVVEPAVVTRLVREAVELNRVLGDPTRPPA